VRQDSSRPLASTRLRNTIVQGLYAGVCAGIVASAGQVLLWSAFGPEAPWLLLRDARLTAAILMGPGILVGPPAFDATVLVVATVIHFGLSIAYGIAFVFAMLRTDRVWLSGVLFGIAIYAVNLHGFVLLFPWFTEARDWIAFAAHLLFGASLSGAYAWLARRAG
jgi:hypothetical protein